jgi:hypothetical protein
VAEIAIAFGDDEDGGEAARAVRFARDRGCLTIAFAPPLEEWELLPRTSITPARANTSIPCLIRLSVKNAAVACTSAPLTISRLNRSTRSGAGWRSG